MDTPLRKRQEGADVATLAWYFFYHQWQFTTSDFLWLGWRGVIRGGAGGRGGGIFRVSGGRGRGGELFYGDSDKVGGDISDHHILAARRHFWVPVGVSLSWHPFGFGRGRALIPRADGQLAFRPALARIFPAFLWGDRTVQDTLLPISI